MSKRPVTNPVESLRNTRKSLGGGDLQGRSRIATPFRPDRLKTASRGVSSSSSNPVGEYLALTGESTTGSAVLAGLDTIQAQAGFDGVAAASDTVKLPVRGAWGVEAYVRFTDGYRGGGTVQVTLGGTAIEEAFPSDVTTEVWGEWRDAVSFIGERNDEVEVSVTATDAGSHTVDVTFRLFLIERLKPSIINPFSPSYFADNEAYVTSIGSPSGGFATIDTIDIDGTNVAEGDLLILHAGMDLYSLLDEQGQFETPSGWTTVINAVRNGNETVQLIAYKTASAADAAGSGSYTFRMEVLNTEGQFEDWSGMWTVSVIKDHGSVTGTPVTENSGAGLVSTPPSDIDITSSSDGVGSLLIVGQTSRQLPAEVSDVTFDSSVTALATDVAASGASNDLASVSIAYMDPSTATTISFTGGSDFIMVDVAAIPVTGGGG